MKNKRAKASVMESSGNVFADLGLPNPSELSLKAELTRQLHNRIKSLRLSQIQAAKRLGINQADVSRLVNGRHTGFSADRLLSLLNSLHVDVEIVLRPRIETRGDRGRIRVKIEDLGARGTDAPTDPGTSKCELLG